MFDFDDIHLFVLDLDGTFYLGDRIFDYSLDFLKALEETGKECLFFTNNSSRSPMDYVSRLNKMGCSITRKQVMTSGDVMIEYLKRYYPGKTVYLLGTPALEDSFRDEGIEVFVPMMDCGGQAKPCSRQDYEVNVVTGGASGLDTHTEDMEIRSEATADSSEYEAVGDNVAKPEAIAAQPDIPDVVVVGFDRTLTYEKLCNACRYIREGAVYLATHPDINCPVPGGFEPDCGAMCALISLSTGRKPLVLGKPARETVEMIVAKTGFGPEQIAFIGDRLYTDVAVGVKNGSKGILVLSGEATMEDVETSDVKPDGIFVDIGEIGREVRLAWQRKTRNERPDEKQQRRWNRT